MQIYSAVASHGSASMFELVRHFREARWNPRRGLPFEAAIEQIQCPPRDRSAWVTRARETPKRRAMSARVNLDGRYGGRRGYAPELEQRGWVASVDSFRVLMLRGLGGAGARGMLW